MSTNKLITNINALVNNVTIPESEIDNVVCIDTLNNRIGVKISQPTSEIDVNGKIKSTNISITNDLSSSNIYASYIYTTSINTINDLSININGNIDLSGDLNVNGTGLIQGEVITTSDDRFKHNEKNINNGLEVIRKLKPQIYDKTKSFKEANFKGKLNEPYIVEAGLIAQEVNKISELKFTVKEGDDNNPYYLNYNNIFVYSLAAIKDLDKKIELMRDEIDNNSKLLIENTNELLELKNKVDIITKISPTSNLGNIEEFIKKQNQLINNLTSKIRLLENRLIKLEK